MKPTERKPRRSFRPSAKKRELLHQRLRESGFDAPADEHIPRRDDRGSAPLSFAQQRLWFLEQLQPDTAGYHLPLAVRITGELDPQVLERSLREIVRRHEVLRTSFPATDGEPVQHVLPPAPVQLAHVDVTALPAGVRARETTRLVTREVRRPFDLAHGPLLRTVLVRLADGEHAVLFNFHHIVVDGWSMGVFLRELTALYPAPASGRGSPLPELPIQYADFAAWQRGHLRGEVLEGHLAYWRRQLAAVPPVLDLVADRPRPAVFSLRGASCPLMVPAELTAAAEAVARTIEATPFMTLLAVFATLLWRSTGQSDLVVGSPVANRGRAELEPLIGFFVNTLALRVDLAPRGATAREPSFHELLERVKETALGAYAHQDLPFEKLVDDLQPDRDLSHTPLFQVMLVLQNAPADSAAGTGLGLRPLPLATPVAKFDLTLELEHWSGGIGGSLVYSTDLFDGTTAVRLAGRFLHLLEGAVAAPGQALGDLPLLAAAERQQVLAEWATAAASPPDPDGEPLLHRLFEAQADRTPEAEALVGRDERLTYRELEQRANQLAHHLRTLGIRPEQRVGICLERSPAIAVAMLAVLKAGGAYVPLDPTLPPERLSFLIADAGVAVVISDRDPAPALPASAADPVLLDADADAIASRSGARPRPTVRGRNLAYVIYTSGTTGQPKGVMVAHEDIARRTAAVAAVYGLGPRDRQLQFFALGFDALGEELYPVLATGGAVLFYSHPLAQAAAEVLEYARVHRLTKINLPPAYWHQVVDEVAAREATVPATLRILTTGGESPSPEKLRLWAAHARPGQRYFNVYGPTEGTILVTAEPVPLPSGARAAGPRIPIGRPLPEVAIYLADARGRAVGIGVPGELLIGGVGVARGYLGQPRLTAERFVPDPLSGDPFAGPGAAGSRLYRTGDLARTRADGRIEYLGRTDRQVKVRGFRIEPEEIEVVLRRHPAVEEAAVVVREDPPGERRLAAYVVPRTPAAEVAELRGFLQQQLPVYMVPAVFVALDALPLAATGKVDLRALPDPGAESGSATRRYLAPRTPEEEILAGIWAEVLGVERVGVDDDFFVLGGDSILSIQIVARARRAGLELTPQQLFQHHTIAELAAGAATGLVAVAEQGPVTGAVALTPIQRWFFEHLLPRPEHWNQSLLLGVGHRLDPAALAAALERLLAHHDVLRLRFRREAGGWRQEIGPPAPPPPLTAVDLTAVASPHRSAAITAAAARTQTSLDLGRGPLLRAVCFDLGDPPARLLLVIHHLAVDAVSWRLLLEDLETAYDALSRGREPVLPAKTTSYKAWAERLEGHATSEETAAELDGWLAAAGAVAPLPVDGERRTNLEASAAAVTVELSPEETRSLLKEVPNAYRTRINDVLLAALARALAWWTGREEVVIDLEGHGREELDEDVDLARTVGWFTAIYPLRLDLSAAAGPGELLKTVKEQLRAVPRHGIGHGLLRYLRRGEELAALPQPEVSFNYLGRVDQGVAGSSRWLAVPEASGPDRGPGGPRTHLLAIDGAVTGGRLRMSWSYGTGVHDRATVEAVAGDFLTTLRELIDHCLSPEAGGYTPSDFPLARIDQALLDRLAAAGPIEDLYPLSPMQQGMLFHSLSDPDSGVYLERTTCELVGELDRTALRRAWQHLVDHHPVLRTAFVWEGTSEPLQVVRPRRELDWRELDWRGAEPAAEEERFAGLLAGERRAGLDLARPPLLRVILVELAADRFRLLWLHHHALLDGWSLPLLTADLFRCYEAFCSGAEPELERRRPYRDYIAWLRSQSPEAAAAHWRETLRGFRAPTPVTGDRPSGPTAADGDPGAVCDRRLGAGVSDDLEALARRERITLSTLVQGLWAVLLSRTSGGYRDVVFGLTTSGRPPELAGVESTLGLYINTVPVRARLERDQPPFPWLRRLQDQVAASRQYEYLPLTQVRAWSEVPGGVELFESLFVFENYPVGEALDRRSAALQVRGFRAIERTNYPLTLLVSPGPRLGLRLIYQTARCDGTTAQRLLAHFATLLGGLTVARAETIDALPFLDVAERHQLLVEWNDCSPRYPSGSLIHELFAAQAAHCPEAVALVWDHHQLSYGELDHRAERLARRLRACGVGPEVLVGLFSERSPEAIVAILGILKAGGAYVPLDPAYPRERLAYMFRDTAMPVLVASEPLLGRLPEELPGGIEVIALPPPSPDGAVGEDRRDPAPSGLAYVMYTSGSTGRPKGVAVNHRNVVRLVRETNFAELGPDQVFLLLAPISFDLSTLEIWGPLLNGGRLAIFVQEPPSLEELGAALARYRVSTLWLTAGLFHQMVEENLAGLRPLRQLLAGGDVLAPAAVKRVSAELDCALIDGYGPTEGTTFTTCHRVIAPHPADRAVPIGRPIANTSVVLLDRDLRPVPIGVPGELFTGGHGVARGYLNAPQPTAEKFVPDPWSREPGGRLYRTGDLARYLPDGRIDFLGRIDAQVKVRGFRVEPGEIETALAAHPAVAQVAVVVHAAPDQPARKRLVAYLVARGAPAPQGPELRSFLADQLPDYLIPVFFVVLDALPLNANAKVDRRELAARDPGLDGVDRPAYTPPRTREEELLAGIWAEVLGAERVGVDDDFFALGGDSILSIRIVSRAQQAGLRLTPRQVFEHPTPARLAAVAGTVETPAAEQGPVTGELPLTPVQHWFFDDEPTRPEHWNQALLLAARQPIAPALLRAAAAAIVDHHDALRLRFERTADGWRQEIVGLGTAVPFSHSDLGALEPPRRGDALALAAARLQASLDLGRGPLLRAACFELGPGEPARLLLVIHHLAVDGVSWRILLEDLQTALRQLTAGTAVELPAKTTSLRRWAEQLAAYAGSEALREEQSYWLAAAERGAPPLPTDFPDGGNTVATTEVVGVALGAEETRALLRDVPNAYRTRIDDVLLTALVTALAPWTGEDRLLLDLEGHGREEILDDLDLSRTVGWFTSIYPVLLELPADGGPGAALKAIKEQLRAVPSRGVGYGLLRYLGADALRRRLAARPGAQLSFNYLGQFDQVLPESALFQPAPESAGPESDPGESRRHLVEVNAQVSGGRLRVGWQYSRERHRRATIRELADRYLEALRELVRHACSPEAGGCTPSDFPLARLDQATVDALVGQGRDVEDVYPLSPLQQGMLLLSLAAPDSAVGCERLQCTLGGGDFDPAAFEQAWARVVARHPVLRTGFAWEEQAEPLQRVHRRVELAWRREDWRRLPAAEQDERWRELAEEADRGFDLARAPLMCLSLIRLADDRYRFSWSYHHLLLDGWSASRVVQELFEHYKALAAGDELRMGEPAPFRDYVAWLADQDPAAAESYWRRTLEGFSGPTLLTAGSFGRALERTAAPGYGDAEQWLSESASDALRALAQGRRLTLNAIFQAAWAVILSRTSGSDDVVFGVTVSGRPATLAGVEAMVGMFINTLPLRLSVPSQAALLSWLGEVRDRQAELSRFEHTPLAELLRWCRIPSARPLFDSLLVFENYPVKPAMTAGSGQRVGVGDVEVGLRANYPFTLVVNPGPRIHLRVAYDQRRLDAVTVGRVLGQLGTVLESIARRPERRIGELPRVPSPERHQLLVEWSGDDRHVLLDDGQPAPIGVPGRLSAGGEMARYLADGELELLGPGDQERRLEGFRFFPRWLERRLGEEAAVAAAWIELRPQGDVAARPVAYLEAAPGAEPDLAGLRRGLERELPEPLLPACVVVAALPRTPDGRVDRAALPEPPRRDAEEGFRGARDNRELRLLALVESTLKRRPISIRDNFFELGGTSLLALHLMAEIRHHFGVRLPVSILFEAPSVERLAQVLRRPEHRSEVSPLVAIQPGSLDPPFFAIHPGGGSIAAYSALVRHLPPEQPFYALQARGRDGEAEPLATVEEMAASYVPAIRRTQPCGPYLIGGWSFGGQVALEVAQRLISAGEEVTLLAIFDQGPQVPERPADYDDSALLRDILPPGFSLSAEELRRLGPIDRQLEHLVEVGHRAGALPLGIGLPEAHSILRMLKVHTRASIDYQARPYPGRVTLYRAEEQHPDLVDDLTLGWNEYVLGGIEIIPVPGTHQTLMREPQVAVVAARLTECLNRARVGAKKGFT